MERLISDEEKIRRAIEISQRRNNTCYRPSTTRVNVNEKKDYKLFKKMALQIVICLFIYIIFYLITSTNYVFSADVIKSTNAILNYDINFTETYNSIIKFLNTNKEDEITNIKDGNNIVEENSNVLENNSIMNETISNELNNIDNLTEEKKTEEEIKDEKDGGNKENEKVEEKKEDDVAKTQMELDADEAKKVCKFSKPLSGTITSEFGEREVLSEVMSADHKGIDIAASSGTSIKAAMSGTVSVAKENSEYGKFIKIVNGDVMTVYAHCQKLKVKVGDKIKAGQIIATVGSTGKSTGPHLHFEIRFENRYINPRYLIEF